MTFSPIDIRSLVSHVGAWLNPSSQASDVVVSCRVRLARNLADYPFLSKLPPEQALEICAQARDALCAAEIDGETCPLSMRLIMAPETPDSSARCLAE